MTFRFREKGTYLTELESFVTREHLRTGKVSVGRIHLFFFFFFLAFFYLTVTVVINIAFSMESEGFSKNLANIFFPNCKKKFKSQRVCKKQACRKAEPEEKAAFIRLKTDKNVTETRYVPKISWSFKAADLWLFEQATLPSACPWGCQHQIL
ncbi:uncharacterized protein LOC113469701 [Diaphorina citri]|uniref:Uncharacterized protein LOC113469701 n=1 Tax=Diaphorina citri TaxID=121845 RepID=A0A3Q0J9H8_DIACI|nr:uncharacterized protein LOC113469701 [Diaphorina citri]